MKFGKSISVMLVLLSGAHLEGAIAQKAALVEEAFGPGRSPYQSTVAVTLNTSVCSGSGLDGVCKISFPVVPAGKRLVVSQASVKYSITNSGCTAAGGGAAVGASPSSLVYLPAPVCVGSLNGSNQRLWVSGPTTYYFEQGSTPLVMITGWYTWILTSETATASLIGYFVPSSLP